MWNWFTIAARRHARDEAGTSLIEYTVVVVLFLLIFFAILDFGRLGFNWVMSEKAMQRAARIATVRPPVCKGENGEEIVPELHMLASGEYGTLCRVAGTCVDGGVQQCVLGTATDFADCSTATGASTAMEIWCTLEPILPSNAAPNNIWVEYRFDDEIGMGFAGGPYTPIVEIGVVTRDIEESNNFEGASQLRFQFMTPIPALAVMAAGGGSTSNFEGGDGTDSLAEIPFPDLSVSLPGEDLNHGTDG